MTNWPSTRAQRVLAALARIGWTVKRQTGSHRVLSRAGFPDYVFAFHETAKFWLDPVRLFDSGGFGRVEINRLQTLVTVNEAVLLRAWHEFFGN